MHTDRSEILTLVATGRMSPREAERLLAVGRDEEETVMRMALGLAFVALVLPYVQNAISGIGHALIPLLPAIERVLLAIGRMA